MLATKPESTTWVVRFLPYSSLNMSVMRKVSGYGNTPALSVKLKLRSIVNILLPTINMKGFISKPTVTNLLAIRLQVISAEIKSAPNT